MSGTTTGSDLSLIDRFRVGLLAFYEALRQTVSLAVCLVGVVLIVIGFLAEPLHPTMGGIIVIWGIAGILTGAVSYAILWLNKRYR